MNPTLDGGEDTLRGAWRLHSIRGFHAIRQTVARAACVENSIRVGWPGQIGRVATGSVTLVTEKGCRKTNDMHLNPVRAGLVDRAVDWRWSAARRY